MKQKMKQEAIKRLKVLTSKYNLNPNLLKYFKEDRLYYSYLTAWGFIGSIDTISYDPAYENAVQEFESKTGYLVYHAIESVTMYGKMLSLLYVGCNMDTWEDEQLLNDYIIAYTINFDFPACSEYGEIKVGQFGSSGALIRIV